MLPFKKFKQHIQHMNDPCTQEQFQIRHGGWITEELVAQLFGEGLTSAGERSERVSAENEEHYTKLMKRGLKHFHDTYGPADDHPPSVSEMSDRIKTRFGELDRMKERDPKKYKDTIDAAEAKLKIPGGPKLGNPVAPNSKTDTVHKIPAKDAPNGHIPASMAFTPDIARHYNSSAHTASGNFKEGEHFTERDVCAGSTPGCRGACLAKTGNYGFTGNKALMDLRTQRLTHNEAATRHHAELAHGMLTRLSEKAKKEGKKVLVRPAVSDDIGPEIHNDAINQSFSETTKNMRYTKKMPKGEHDPEGKEQTTVSDPGPMVEKKDGSKTVDTEGAKQNINDRRMKSLKPNNVTHPRYMVFNRHRGFESGTDEKGRPPTSRHTPGNIDHLTRVRRYEPDPSTPAAGEKDSYHHPDGYGRVEHNGHSYRYQDHSVVQNATTTDGKSLRPYEHDARIPEVDVPKEKLKTPSGKTPGGIVPSLSVKSTPKAELHNSPFFHHVENIDHNGIYHDGHPAEMEQAGHKPTAPGSGQPKVRFTKKSSGDSDK